MKKCKCCKTEKDLKFFYKNKKMSDGYLNKCKKCSDKDRIKSRRTKDGLIGVIYSNQKQNSKARGHSHPEYSKQELKDWLFAQDLFHEIHEQWEHSGYIKRLTPSVDRIKDNINYCLNNIQLMTWGENDDKGHIDLKSAKLFDNHSPVSQFSLNGGFVKTFISQAEASRKTNINKGNIGECCRHIRKTAGGFKWEYYN